MFRLAVCIKAEFIFTLITESDCKNYLENRGCLADIHNTAALQISLRNKDIRQNY